MFNKLNLDRFEHRRVKPRTRVQLISNGPSALNILCLVVLFMVVLLGGWHWWKASALRRQPGIGVTTTNLDQGESVLTSEGQPEVIADGPVNSAANSVSNFSFEGEGDSAMQVNRSREHYGLPKLSFSTTSRSLIARATELVRENPADENLRQYVIAAHIFLMQQEISRHRFREGLNLVKEMEQWGLQISKVASFKAALYGKLGEHTLAEKWALAALGYPVEVDLVNIYHILGKAYFFQEELPNAIEAFEKALEIRQDPEILSSLNTAKRELESSFGFDRQRLAHFIVRYDGETMEQTGRMVLDALDRSYVSLKSQMGFEPSEPVVVILYSRRSYTEMGGPHWSSGLFDGKIRIPAQGLEHLDQRVIGTLHHELAHAFIHARAGKRVPRWLNEGIAEHFEGTRTESVGESLAKILEREGSVVDCVRTAKCDMRFFYPAAASIINYIIRMRGIGGIRDVLEKIGEGRDIDAALQDVVGRDEIEVIEDWQHFIRRRYS